MMPLLRFLYHLHVYFRFFFFFYRILFSIRMNVCFFAVATLFNHSLSNQFEWLSFFLIHASLRWFRSFISQRKQKSKKRLETRRDFPFPIHRICDLKQSWRRVWRVKRVYNDGVIMPMAITRCPKNHFHSMNIIDCNI